MYLAIDTSTAFLSLALHDGRQLLAESTWQTATHHSLELGPRVAAMLAGCGVTGAAGLKGIGVALGPGTFTGLRAGLALAKGLAVAGPVPLVGLPSLDVLAAAQPRPANERTLLVAILAAGRGRLFAASYRWQGARSEPRPESEPRPRTETRARAEARPESRGPDGEPPLSERWTQVQPPRIVSWDDVPDLLAGEGAIFCGEIDAAGAAALKKLGRRARLVPGAQGLRRAGYLAELAIERLARGEGANPATLVPLYLHEPGAKGG